MFDDLKNKEANKTSVSKISSGSGSDEASKKIDVQAQSITSASQLKPVKQTFDQNKTNDLEDIFSSTETEQKPTVFQPKENIASKSGANFEDVKKPKMLINKLFFLASLIVIIALIGLGGYMIYNYIFSSTEIQIEKENELSGQEELETPAKIIHDPINEEVENPIKTEPEENNNLSQTSEVNNQVDNGQDSDQDGLTDMEELELGTNAQVADTDQDGLFDREEVQVYKTDPLNPDTDGDSFLDGAEVDAGYNPKGTGKLFKI